MNRYKSSTKIKPESSATIIFEDQFEQGKEEPQTLNNIRYKSIPSKAQLLLGEEILQDEEYNDKFKERPVDELKMTQFEPPEKIKMNNFLGSKKAFDRKPDHPRQQQLNPQKPPKNQPVDEEDPNKKLAKLVQRQIEDREKWQKKAEQKQKSMQQFSSQNEQSSNNLENSLLVINNTESLKKASSKQKLQRISTQKFSAMNLTKNNFLQNKGEQQDYQNPKSPPKQGNQEESPQKKKRTVSQLRPLKKKPSTYEVMNQLDMVRKKDNENKDNEPPKKAMIKKRVIAKDINDLESFNRQELERGTYIQGTLERNKSGICNLLWPEYRLIFDGQNIIYAKKNMKGYDIMLDPSHPSFLSSKKLATVRSNFIGSYYNIFQGEEEKQILATIYYNTDSKSVTREVEFYVKRRDLKYWDCDRDHENDTAFYSLKSLYLQGDNRCDGKIRKYVNKKPFFHEKTKSYKMDFGGKATILSVNNAVLVEAYNQRENAFVFGKSGDNTFGFKGEHPLSPVVIMGYLMSSFNFKFATQ